jgi:hypothetical protein
VKTNLTNGPYEVGYGRLPKRTRFKAGQSGNLAGRPKGSLNLATVLERMLREEVTVTAKGCSRVLTKLEAAVMKLVDKAAAGDGRAIRYLCQLTASTENRSVAVAPSAQIAESDQKVMSNILKRFQQSSKGGNDASDDK